MSCKRRQTDQDRLKVLQASLPLIRGSIIKEDGTVVDLADYLDVPKTPIDPQIEKLQFTYPYIRDMVVFDNGQTCSLTALIDALLGKIVDAGLVYSDELRLTYRQLTDADWGIDPDEEVEVASSEVPVPIPAPSVQPVQVTQPVETANVRYAYIEIPSMQVE